MKFARTLAFAALAGATIISAGCSVARDQQTVGSYVDDAGITTAVKARMAEDKTVSATSISVETLKGTVQLSGFAKSQAEKNQAENIARNTKYVREVRNSIVVRPYTVHPPDSGPPCAGRCRCSRRGISSAPCRFSIAASAVMWCSSTACSACTAGARWPFCLTR